MCGRFTLTVHQLAEVAAEVEAWLDPEHASRYRASYNIAPTRAHWILRYDGARREVVPGRWGLVNAWAKDPSMGVRQFNARSETVAEKPSFRAAFRARRCAVPVDGFYEWRGPKGAREPVHFHAPDRSLLWLAGLYEGWAAPDTGEVVTTFTLITTSANALVSPIHDRMPVLLERDAIGGWLGEAAVNDTDLHRWMRPAPDERLVFLPASRRVNSVRDDDPALLEADPEVAGAQLGLFG